MTRVRFVTLVLVLTTGFAFADPKVTLKETFGRGIVTGSVLSPDGKRLAVLAGNRVVLFDAETREPTGDLTGDLNAILRTAAFDPKGDRLAAVTAAGTVSLWTLGRKPKRVQFDAVPTDTPTDDARFSLAFTANGIYLHVRCDRRGAEPYGVLWDVEEGRAFAGRDYTGRLSDDGRWLLPTGDERRFFHLPSRQWFAGLVTHSPKALAFVAPEKPTLVQLLTSNTLEPLGYVRLAEGERVLRLALTRQRGFLGVTLRRADGSILSAVWDIRAKRDDKWQVVRELSNAVVTALAGTPDQPVAVVEGEDGHAFALNVVTGEVFSSLTKVAVSSDGSRFAGRNGAAVELWRVGDAAPTTIPMRSAESLRFSDDGRHLVGVVPGRNRPSVFDTESGQLISPSTLTPKALASCGLSFGFDELAATPALSDGYAFAGRPLSGELVRLLPENLQEWTRRWVISEGMSSCDALPPAVDSHYRDGYEILPEICWTYNRPAKVWAIAVSDGDDVPERIAGIRLWHNDTYDALGTLDGHERIVTGKHLEYVHFLEFSRDGTYLVSAGHDRTVRVWDFAGRRLVTTLTGHLAPVRFVAVAPDGSAFLSGSDDGTVRLWTISNGRPTATP
jgi:WD40 repeat protein